MELPVALSVGELEMVVLSLPVWLLVALQLAVALGETEAVTDGVGEVESPGVSDVDAEGEGEGVWHGDADKVPVFEAVTVSVAEREAATEALADGDAATDAVAVSDAVREAETVGEWKTLGVGVRLRPRVGEALGEALGVGVAEAVSVREIEALTDADADVEGVAVSVGEPTSTNTIKEAGRAEAYSELPGCLAVKRHTAGASVATVSWSVAQADALDA